MRVPKAALPSRFQACNPSWCSGYAGAWSQRLPALHGSAELFRHFCCSMSAGQPARPCCATPRCLVRTRNSRVAPSRGPPDPGGYSTIHSSPILTSAVQPTAPRRATCIIHCHRHIRAPPASWDRKISHQRHPSTARLHILSRAGWQGCLLPAAALVTYSAGLHTMSHQITLWP